MSAAEPEVKKKIKAALALKGLNLSDLIKRYNQQCKPLIETKGKSLLTNQSLSNKFKRDSLTFNDVVHYLDCIGYDIIFSDRESDQQIRINPDDTAI